MTFGKTAFLFCALGIIAAANPNRDDGDTFKGEWKTLSVKQNGKAVPEEFVKMMKFKFDGQKYVQSAGDMSEEGNYTLDASKMPKTIDLDIKSGNDSGKKQLGIYKIEDGKLTFIFSSAGSKDRPKTFQPAEGDDAIEFVLERDKS
jgi:uncharacterized protein (TIGR03067 family)